MQGSTDASSAFAYMWVCVQRYPGPCVRPLLTLSLCDGLATHRDRDDTPPGLSPDDSLEFEVELVSFEREGHWQVGPRGKERATRRHMQASSTRAHADAPMRAV